MRRKGDENIMSASAIRRAAMTKASSIKLVGMTVTKVLATDINWHLVGSLDRTLLLASLVPNKTSN